MVVQLVAASNHVLYRLFEPPFRHDQGYYPVVRTKISGARFKCETTWSSYLVINLTNWLSLLKIFPHNSLVFEVWIAAVVNGLSGRTIKNNTIKLFNSVNKTLLEFF